tara:strand:- start:189 stop:893 length:705 start_codon:yes stop_codon:yes gene_type:complete
MFGLPNSEIVTAIYQLLPGFVSAWIFFGLTSYPRTSPFERVIQALIFTLFAEALAQLTGLALVAIGPHWFTLGPWSPEAAFVWKVLYAILIGLLAASCVNTNRLSKLVPNWISQKTFYPSEWFGVFSWNARYVYLHLEGGRRLYGWPEEYPEKHDEGHFVLMKAEWILPDNQRVPLIATERFLIPAKEVCYVEFEFADGDMPEYAEGIAEQAAQTIVQYNDSIENDEDSEDVSK